MRRSHEIEADLISAKITGQIQGGIDYFTALNQNSGERSFLSPLLNLFSSHPSFDTRIAYLTEFEENMPTQQY